MSANPHDARAGRVGGGEARSRVGLFRDDLRRLRKRVHVFLLSSLEGCDTAGKMRYESCGITLRP